MASALYTQQVPTPDTAPVHNKSNPFLPNAPVTLRMPPAGGIFHGVNGNDDLLHLATIRADGVLQLWDETDFPIFDTAHDDGAIAIVDADYLRIVALVNGNPIKRVSSGGAPAAGEFTMDDNAGSMEFKTGTVYGLGTIIKVYVFTAAEVIDQTVAADALPDQGVCQEFMIGTLAATLEKAS